MYRGFLATTCKKGVLHFNEDFLIVEKKFINHEKTKFHPIITDLLRTTQPVIRYELNDIVSIKENCKCGSKFMAIDKVEGRSDDIILLSDDNKKTVKIFPDVFRRTIVLSDDRIKDYSMIQKTENTLELYIDSEFSNSFLSAKKSIIKMLEKYNISKVEILKVNKLQFTVGDKKRRIKNEYSWEYKNYFNGSLFASKNSSNQIESNINLIRDGLKDTPVFDTGIMLLLKLTAIWELKR